MLRDSSGIEIVENTVAAETAAEVWTLAQPARVVIGASDGGPAHQLFRVGGAVRLADGRIAVLNSGSFELRIFGATGEHVQTAGGRGEGPGEFARPNPLVRLSGDSLGVWDARLLRFTVFAPDGSFARVARLERAVLNPELVGVLAGNHIMLSDFRLDVPDRGFATSSATFVRYTGDGEFADSIGTFPWMEIGIIGDPAQGRAGRRIFAPRTHAAALGTRFWVGTAVESSIGEYDVDGGLRRIIRWSGDDRTVEPSHVARHLEARCADASPELCSQFHELPVMERFPAHETLVADTAGNLWVQSFWRPAYGEEVPWRVFDGDGRLIARILLPAAVRPLDIGEDWLVGLRTDELGVERVLVQGIVK